MCRTPGAIAAMRMGSPQWSVQAYSDAEFELDASEIRTGRLTPGVG